tara:strand:+ start:208 stop:453 length:246 start_codon:yes stop_codon:yes gene_type:complete
MTQDDPVPASEVSGIISLTSGEVEQVVRKPTTLAAFQAAGGISVIRDEIDESRVLEPFDQLRRLPMLMSRHPGYFDRLLAR